MGGLYHAVSHHDAHRINHYLCILIGFFIVYSIAALWENVKENRDQDMSSVAIYAGIMGVFAYYIHGYAKVIKRLEMLEYPVE